MSASTFKRQPAPLLMRCLLGAFIEGSWRRSRGDWKYSVGATSRPLPPRAATEVLAKHNPFQNYVASCHDVFVAAYVKSGTNWMMQIAHQLLNHGKGEFGHIHDVFHGPSPR